MVKTNIHEIYQLLLKNYGLQGWWPLNGVYKKEHLTKKLTPDEQFEISVGAILTQYRHFG